MSSGFEKKIFNVVYSTLKVTTITSIRAWKRLFMVDVSKKIGRI